MVASASARVRKRRATTADGLGPRTASVMLLSAWPRRGNDRVEPLDTFERVVEAEWSCLYRVALRLGADAHEAEDIVQESLLNAFRQLREMRREELLTLEVHWWLKAIVRRTAACAWHAVNCSGVCALRNDRR